MGSQELLPVALSVPGDEQRGKYATGDEEDGTAGHSRCELK